MAAQTKQYFSLFTSVFAKNGFFFKGLVFKRVFDRNNFFTCDVQRYSQKKLEKPGIKVQKVITPDGDVVEVKKKIFQARITLLSPDNSLQVLTLEEANKIAKRRNLKLCQIAERDTKTDRPVYKLMQASEFAEAKNKISKAGTQKDEKLITINSKISDNDLMIKVNHILKWLKKEQTVKVTISGDPTAAETVFGKISDHTKEAGRIPQKVFKGGEIRFHILLPKKPKAKSTLDRQEESHN